MEPVSRSCARYKSATAPDWPKLSTPRLTAGTPSRGDALVAELGSGLQHLGQHRARCRLVAAHLDAVAGVPVVIGGIHDPGRQPQHALLDLGQDGQADARAAVPGGACGHPASMPAPCREHSLRTCWALCATRADEIRYDAYIMRRYVLILSSRSGT